jgi:hypothetical protein
MSCATLSDSHTCILSPEFQVVLYFVTFFITHNLVGPKQITFFLEDSYQAPFVRKNTILFIEPLKFFSQTGIAS